MRFLPGLMLLLTVGCISEPLAWHERISAELMVPDEMIVGDYDFAESYAGQAQFSREVAFEILLKTSGFSSGGTGASGSTIKPQIHAFKTIARQPDAAIAFNDLLRRARPAGKAYALCGLYEVDRKAFEQISPGYSRSTATLTEWSGCTGRTIALGEMVRDSTATAIRLEPGQSLDEWFREHPDGGTLDIVGGGYPAALANIELPDAGRASTSPAN